MIEAKVINKEDLITYYGPNVPLMSDRGRFDEANTINLTNEPESFVGRYINLNSVVDRTNMTYFQLSKFKSSSYRNVLIPKWLIKTVQMQSVSEIIIPILEKMMPGRWYIDAAIYGSSTMPQLFLHYPQVTLTNKLKQLHTIYDLVVQVPLQEETGLAEQNIYGCRYAFTQQELNAGYQHSHLSKDSLGHFQAFCTGGGSEFQKFLKSLTGGITANSFALFLIQLQSYLSWESLEGTPYISISSMLSWKGNSSEEVADPRGNLSTEHVNAVALGLLKILKPEFVHITNGHAYCNPGLNPTEFLKQEVELIRICDPLLMLTERQYVHDFDVVNNKYVTQTNAQGRLPRFDTDSIHKKLMSTFKIEPRIIKVETEVKKETTNIVPRFSPYTLDKILTRLNFLLAEHSKK